MHTESPSALRACVYKRIFCLPSALFSYLLSRERASVKQRRPANRECHIRAPLTELLAAHLLLALRPSRIAVLTQLFLSL
ncbi:hypothetical protein L596_020929 [Steinernema carpocapsae]|uniref:Uncharacterized protein n=1 Tax=Steinernema carpocapsae TaxID=34508 RepID=A0A4U5MVL9_STECR|nr:hypothetical protein L596_020929 [Steinernema carpocapsae]